MGEKFSDKLKDLLTEEFIDACKTEDTEALQKRVYDYRKIIEDTEREKSEDEALSTARSEVRRLGLKYTEIIKNQQAMIKYIFHTLRERSGENK